MRILTSSITLIIFISFNLLAQSEWIKLTSPTSIRISKLFCTDSLNYWAVGDSGLIIHTSNAGSSWEVQNSGLSNPIQDIFFLNNNLGWAVSARFDSLFGSYILKTKNGGEVWEKEFFSIENKFFQTIYFLDSLNGFVAGSPSGAFYGTTDGGRNWNTPRISGDYSNLPVQKIVFLSNRNGFACGGMHDLIGVIWKTTDAGLNWLSKSMGFEPLHDLYFIDSLNIIGVGGDFEYGTSVARTLDGGANWIYELPGYLGVATGISFRTKSEAWACLGSESKFIVSADSGKTWGDISTYNNAAIYDIVFTDSLNGMAVGDSGVILKYKYNVTDIGHNNTNLLSAFNLFQNYPNPFNPITKIKYEIPNVTVSGLHGSSVQLKVYDVLGNEVIILVDEFKPAGKYEVEFNSNLNQKILSNGVYFYQLKFDSFVVTKKMILLR